MPERQRGVHDGPITGAGFYRVASYLMHSCEPNVKLVFSEHSHRASVVATRDITAGDELLVGYINSEARSTDQRRLELFTKYRYQCTCSRCENVD